MVLTYHQRALSAARKIYLMHNGVQYVSALTHAGAVMRSESAGSGNGVKHPVPAIPAKGELVGFH